MRKYLLFSILIILSAADITLSSAAPRKAKPEPAGRMGEKIVYNIKMAKVSLGSAEYYNVKRTLLNGQAADLITFNTKMVRFKDLEKIYSDPRTFLPLKVERDINNWPVQEKITELYDQKKFVLTITKFKGRKKEEMVIKKTSVIHNSIMLPFYLRRIQNLKIGWTFTVQLPTQQFKIKLVAIENVSVPAGKFKAYRFESVPQKFQIWVTTDERRIPVKIRGAGALNYTMVMRDYNPPSQ
ncbi:MAG: DUF3108 domain-containing protein [Deltaproteobacteria bacterium]